MDIKRIFVVGSGIMGKGITQVAAEASYEVHMYSRTEEEGKKAFEDIKGFIDKQINKGQKTIDQRENILQRINLTNNLEDARSSQLVVESIPEKLELKKDMFRKLNFICEASTILATNTSTLMITDIASATERPEKVIGMHFSSPVPLMGMVEIVKGVKTSQDTIEVVKEVTKTMKKTPIMAEKDFPGFLLNRVWLPMVNEAIYAVMDGIGTVEDLDRGFQLCYGNALGPIRTADLAGLDVIHDALEAMYNYYGNPKYKPCPLLTRMIKAGYYGKKSGKGFYSYD